MGRDYLSGAGGPSAAPLLGGGYSSAAAAGGGGGGGTSGTVVAPRSRRQTQDRGWGVACLALVALCLAGGLYALTHTNPDFVHSINPKYLSDPAHCPVAAEPTRNAFAALGDDPPPPPVFSPKFFLAAASFYIALSIAGGIALGVAAMALYRKAPRLAVYGAIALQIALPLGGGVAVLSSGAPFAAAAPLLLVAAVVAFCYHLYREQLGLVAQLLGTASQAVSAVWGVVVATVGLQVAAALTSLPLLASAVAAYSNGRVVPSPLVASIVAAASSSTDDQPPRCLDASGASVLCCSWRPDGWAAALVALCAVALAWTSLLAFCLKTYVVSGAVARWYFAPATASAAAAASGSAGLLALEAGGADIDPSAAADEDDDKATPTTAALRDAFGPSFGSCALAAWLLALIGWARSLLAQLREQARDSFFAQLLLSCADVLYSILEQLTKFGVVFSAVTGDAFLPAARGATALLSRNLLDTVAVWVFPSNVLGLTNLTLGIGWAAIAGLSSYRLAFLPMAERAAAAAGGAAAGGDPSAATVALQSAGVVAVVAFAFGYAALSFLASILLSAVDAVYLCFAIDRDRAMVTREEIHAVLVLLPSANKASSAEGPGGGIVENPNGGLAFGREHGGPAAV